MLYYMTSYISSHTTLQNRKRPTAPPSLVQTRHFTHVRPLQNLLNSNHQLNYNPTSDLPSMNHLQRPGKDHLREKRREMK